MVPYIPWKSALKIATCCLQSLSKCNCKIRGNWMMHKMKGRTEATWAAFPKINTRHKTKKNLINTWIGCDRFLFRQPQSIHIRIFPLSFGQRVITLKHNLCQPTPDVLPLSIGNIETGYKLNPLSNYLSTTGWLCNQFNINIGSLQRLR